MHFSQILAILSLAASSTLATPQFTHELSKRTCWELTGEALKICQEACTLACEAATAGLAKEACGTACDASELKVREVEAARDVLPLVEARETSTNSTASTSAQVTSIDAVTFPKVDASVGREACVVACEVTCNSTVLALIQSECLSECKSLCPDS